MPKALDYIKSNKNIIILFLAIIAVTAIVELSFGRLPLGPDGRFGWWDNNIWGSENSQRVADVYSFSHIIHGMLFYGFLFWLLRRVPLKYRFLIAMVIEASWEILENSPIIINRYREATIAQGYTGDSVLNSCCDILMAAIGFYLAWRWPVWLTVLSIVMMEVGCLLWVRDNLTLNVLMLVYPSKAIKTWQSFGHAIP